MVDLTYMSRNIVTYISGKYFIVQAYINTRINGFLQLVMPSLLQNMHTLVVQKITMQRALVTKIFPSYATGDSHKSLCALPGSTSVRHPCPSCWPPAMSVDDAVSRKMTRMEYRWHHHRWQNLLLFLFQFPEHKQIHN